MLEKLTEDWTTLEMDHRVSKTASEAFWELGKWAFPRLYKAKIDEVVLKNIPKFVSQRRKLHKDNVPPVHLEIGYLDKETKEVVLVEGDKTPKSRFHPTKFQKVYEVASVKVIDFSMMDFDIIGGSENCARYVCLVCLTIFFFKRVQRYLLLFYFVKLKCHIFQLVF